MITSNMPRVGHAAREIVVPIVVLFVWDVVVTIFYFKVTPHVRPIELQFSLFGSALALYIGISVNAAYGRWWEARGLWGLMINASRNVTREALMFCDNDVQEARQDLAREIGRSQIAYVNVLRTSLRGQPVAAEAQTYLKPEKAGALETIVNKQNAILTDIGLMAQEAYKRGMIDSFSRVRIESTLVDIANAQGGMERIKNTPLPSQYRSFPSFFAKVFCVILPFAIVQDLGIYTPIGSGLVGIMFMMAVQISLDLMDPFANDVYDVPMTSHCNTVEIDLLQMMGDTPPAKMKPENGVLW